MSGDLEDFLRRAAQRRQAKVAQDRASEQTGQQSGRGRPEYSNRKTERQVSTAHDDVLTAEIIEEDDLVTAPVSRLEKARIAAAQDDPGGMASQARRSRAASVTRNPRSSGVAITEDPVQYLISMLKQPGGIRQAILLKEILERPEHRW